MEKIITFCGQPAKLACDGQCHKAWGINNRPRILFSATDPDDCAYLSDADLATAPNDPGTYEGGEAKPEHAGQFPTKWCARECERASLTGPDEPALPPFLAVGRAANKAERQASFAAGSELPLLVCTMGLPRSGKTTWARRQGWPIVCPDDIRLALHGQRMVASAEPFVWAIAKTMVRALFRSGSRVVILDATNTVKARRAEWFDPAWLTVFKVFSTSAEECLQRAHATSDAEIVPVIARMAETFEPLDDTCLRLKGG